MGLNIGRNWYPGRPRVYAGLVGAGPGGPVRKAVARAIAWLSVFWLLLLLAARCSLGFPVAAGPAYPPRPDPPRLLNDFAGMFSPGERESLESRLLELNERTSVQFAVVTVKSLDGVSIEEYAVKLFEKWGIGEKGKDNGLLLLVARDEREMRFEVGYGLEGVLPDAFCGRVIDEVLTPHFKSGDYAGGIRAAISAIGARLEGSGEFAPGEGRAAGKSRRQNDLIPALITLAIILLFLYSGNRRRQVHSPGGDAGSGPLPRPIFTPTRRNPQGGGRKSGGFGGFGGFGGGRSGGGGASGKW